MSGITLRDTWAPDMTFRCRKSGLLGREVGWLNGTPFRRAFLPGDHVRCRIEDRIILFANAESAIWIEHAVARELAQSLFMGRPSHVLDADIARSSSQLHDVVWN